MIQASELPDTKERILDAAERLFADEGLEGASLRSITSAAGVNLAAVNYHFHSKQALVEAVLARRLGPVNRQRLEMLQTYIRKAGAGPLSLEPILEAFLAPALWLRRDLGERGACFARFIGRLHAEPGEHVNAILKKQFGGIVAEFTQAMRRALPGIAESDFAWGVHFTIGAMAHTMIGGGFVRIYSGESAGSCDADVLLRRLVTYTAAGLHSLAAPPKTKRSRDGHK